MMCSIWAYYAVWANEERRWYKLANPWGTGRDAEF